MRLRRVSFLVLLLFLFHLLSVLMPIFAEKVESNTSDQRVFLEIPQDSFCRYPSSTVTVPIIIGNLDPENRTLIVRKIEIYTTDGKLVSEKSMFSPISSISTVVSTPEEVRSALGIKVPSREKIDKAKTNLLQAESMKAPLAKDEKEERRRLVLNAYYSLQYEYLAGVDMVANQYVEEKLYREFVSIDLETIKQGMEPVDFVSLKARILLDDSVTLVKDGTLIDPNQNSQISVESQFNVFLLEALPMLPNWHAGDGHVHTRGLSFEPERDDTIADYTGNPVNYGFSDAESSSVSDRVNVADQKGYDWIILTDHAGDWSHTTQPRLEQDEWDIYNTACSEATSKVAVCPGEEVATKELGVNPLNTGHLLCYANSSFVYSYGTHQGMINAVNASGGFSIVAHPYCNDLLNWDDWNVTGFSGIELVSGLPSPLQPFIAYEDEAVHKWDELLTQNLSETLSNPQHPFIVGLSGSDSHNKSLDQFGRNMTYIFTGRSDTPSKNDIYDAIKKGRVIASSDGSFAAFTVRKYDTSNYAGPGQIIEVNTGDTLEFVVYYRQVNDVSTNVRIKIISNNGEILNGSNGEVVQGPSGYRTYYGTITKSRYYRVQVEFENPEGYVFVNPAYVKVNTSPNFSLSASPPSQTVSPGVSTSYTVNLTSQNGFN